MHSHAGLLPSSFVWHMILKATHSGILSRRSARLTAPAHSNFFSSDLTAESDSPSQLSRY